LLVSGDGSIFFGFEPRRREACPELVEGDAKGTGLFLIGMADQETVRRCAGDWFLAFFAPWRFNTQLLLNPHLVLDAFDMASAQALDFTAELEEAADPGIIEHAEAVYKDVMSSAEQPWFSALSPSFLELREGLRVYGILPKHGR
jgi:hypothetical protein